MSSRCLCRLLPILLAAGLGLAGSAVADPLRDASVGADGVLYFIHEGTYGELFPGQGLAEPANSALAIDVVRPDQSRERLLVPGTESRDTEDSSSLLFEDHSGMLFVLWQTKINVIHSRLTLIGLRDGEWTESIEVSGSPFGWKSAPQLAVTRDTFRTVEGDGSLRRWARTVVHLLWWEESASGQPQALYSPVTLLDGVYTGWNPVYRLDDLVLGGHATEIVPPNPGVAAAPKIEPGSNGQSVVVGFVGSSSGELVSITIELLPGEISSIADRIRHQIDDLGRSLLPAQPDVLASKVRHQIDDLGARLSVHPGFTSYLASKAHAEVLAADPSEPIESLAERIRHQIDDLGARMTDRGLDRLAEKDALDPVVISSVQTGGEPRNVLRIVQASSRTTPTTGTDSVALYLSKNGREVLVSWLEDGVVYYRESRGTGWSDIRPLRLGSELDLGRARQILARRAAELSDE